MFGPVNFEVLRMISYFFLLVFFFWSFYFNSSVLLSLLRTSKIRAHSKLYAGLMFGSIFLLFF